MERHVVRCCATLLAAALIWCASDTVSFAAKDPVPIPDTVWLTVGKLNAKATMLGGFKAPATTEIGFSEGAAPGLPASGSFGSLILDTSPEGGFFLNVYGSYAQDEKGKIELVVDEEVLAGNLADLLEAVLLSEGIEPDSVTAEVLKTKAKAKSGFSTKKGEYLKLKLSGQAVVTVVLGPQIEILKVKYSYRGEGVKT